MKNPWPIIHRAKSLLNAKSNKEEHDIIYHIRCAVDEYEEELIKDSDNED